MTTPDWIDTLNPPQRRAVQHRDGPLLVLAGAGSGKTRVLTHRVAYLIEVCDVSPKSIVAVTFTNRAADEMRQRVDRLIADDEAARDVVISTFHSLGARLLRRHAPRAGLDWSFSIYDSTDQKSLISDVAERLGKDTGRKSVRRHQNYINSRKNQAQTPQQAQEVAYDARSEESANFYANYQAALRDADAVDFGDLILEPLRLFREDPGFAKKLSHIWQYLMVDEFQDTNDAQYELLEHLTAVHDNLAVVGDDDQSIYRWRGADPSHILDFDEAFESAEVVKLEQNYRSTGLILDAANDVIAENDRRHNKTLWTDRAQGSPINVFTARDDREEAGYVAESIFDELRKGADPEDFAIFYRINAQGRLFEEQLRQYGIDYRIVGGLSFYDRMEIKDVLAYLRAALNPADDVATARIINTPRRGIGDKTVEKLRDAIAIDGIDNLQDAAQIADEGLARDDLFSPRISAPGDEEILEELDSISGVSIGGISTFRQLIEQTRDDLMHFESLGDVVERLLERTAYPDHIKSTDADNAEDRLRNIGELISAIEEFEEDETTPALLESVRESMPDDADDPLATSEASMRLRAFLDRSALVRQTDDSDDGAVTLMTIHGAKGLEFDTVFVVGMEEDTFPKLRDDDPEELAEERRLAYVAITRAENNLHITNAKRRRVYGKYRDTEPSRFLLDIEPERLRLDPRSSSTSIDYAASRRPSSSDRHSRHSTRSSSSSSSSWSFDQSSPSADSPDSFNQAPPQWESGASSSDAGNTTAPGRTGESSSDLVGTTVSHSRFGPGKVVEVSGSGDKARLTIDFPAVGQKTIVRKFVKILG